MNEASPIVLTGLFRNVDLITELSGYGVINASSGEQLSATLTAFSIVLLITFDVIILQSKNP